MDLDVGYVCAHCDCYAPLGATICPRCARALGFDEPGPTIPPARFSVAPPPEPEELIEADPLPSLDHVLEPTFPTLGEAAPAPRSEPAAPPVGPHKIPLRFVPTEALMDQARSYVCKKCYSPVPQGHKFCGRCGEPVPREVLGAQTIMFSKMLEPGKAKLVLIKGEGFQSDPSDETAYLLGGRQHPCGRTQGDILFEHDPWVSPLHATFFYRDDGKLVIRDEASLNGVFVRVRAPMPIQPGDTFLAGEQVFRLETTPRPSDGNDAEGTQFYSSPKRVSPFRVVQILRNGILATQVCARESSLTVGREGCDMNFPNDPYMSTRHARVELTAQGGFVLLDTGSKNGTYLSIRGERELNHGDYLFIGRELLRVDISA
ncbi:MAG: FHA domain-containing protein [Deltaproteobacteria bacterium]|nr:FHA domain-containing protein [Myxococcales bacterium]MDP3214438.1 FHA domain-containing protein [Deltaproteobacteria bacterium]